MIKTFIGLGNPGTHYSMNRHNVGFMIIDALADAYKFSAWTKQSYFLKAEGIINTQKIILLKPQSFMNCSGIPTASFLNFYKIPLEYVLVIHDDLNLPSGKLKIKQGGSSGGHNGLKSIDSHNGQDYWRLRIGIGHPGHPGKVSDYVLSNFSKDDLQWLEPLINKVLNNISLLVSKEWPQFLTQTLLDHKI